MRKIYYLILCGEILVTLISCKEAPSGPRLQPTVSIEKTEDGYEFIRNGRPFLVKGAAGQSNLKELKMAGGNTLRLYDTINLKQKLDSAQRLNLAVVVDIPLPRKSKYLNSNIEETIKKIRRLVSQHKDHPALLYWNLGNELEYPMFYKRSEFLENFNSLIGIIKELDPNHPVGTAVIGGIRKLPTLSSMAIRSPKLDLVSFNIFGSITSLEENLNTISLVWSGPYIVSEWGVNGPWEEEETAWKAPIEKTSTEKARILKERYNSKLIESDACLGSFVFYWGIKQESTHTWFSLFDEEGRINEARHTLTKLWAGDTSTYEGPKINHSLLNGKRASESIILSPGKNSAAKVLLQAPSLDSLNFVWQIRKEAWVDIYEKQKALETSFSGSTGEISFVSPEEEGPYRLFIYVYDRKNNYATENIPFYVLNPDK